MKTFEEFCKAVDQRESSGNYQAKNSLGYLGYYQFGMARLCDLGLTHHKPGDPILMANDDFEWNPPYSEALFLANPDLQDAIFRRHVEALRRQIDFWFCIDDQFSMSGGIAVCHLLGFKGLRSFWLYGIDDADGNGTKASDYYESFKGYEV